MIDQPTSCFFKTFNAFRDPKEHPTRSIVLTPELRDKENARNNSRKSFLFFKETDTYQVSWDECDLTRSTFLS